MTRLHISHPQSPEHERWGIICDRILLTILFFVLVAVSLEYTKVLKDFFPTVAVWAAEAALVVLCVNLPASFPLREVFSTVMAQVMSHYVLMSLAEKHQWLTEPSIVCLQLAGLAALGLFIIPFVIGWLIQEVVLKLPSVLKNWFTGR